MEVRCRCEIVPIVLRTVLIVERSAAYQFVWPHRAEYCPARNILPLELRKDWDPNQIVNQRGFRVFGVDSDLIVIHDGGFSHVVQIVIPRVALVGPYQIESEFDILSSERMACILRIVGVSEISVLRDVDVRAHGPIRVLNLVVASGKVVMYLNPVLIVLEQRAVYQVVRDPVGDHFNGKGIPIHEFPYPSDFHFLIGLCRGNICYRILGNHYWHRADDENGSQQSGDYSRGTLSLQRHSLIPLQPTVVDHTRA